MNMNCLDNKKNPDVQKNNRDLYFFALQCNNMRV